MNRSILLSVCSSALAIAPVHQAQASFLGESPLSVIPQDVDVSPDGTWALVRGESSNPNDAVSLWDLASATRFFPPLCTASFGLEAAGAKAPADLVALTNDRAVVIGSIEAAATTYIDLLQVDLSGPVPLANCFGSTIVSGTTSGTTAGFANDVDVSPNGQWAAVNHANYLHVISLGNGVVTPFNIGSNPAGPCTPDGGVDSIALSDSRVVAITNRFIGNQEDLWVYVIDLTGPAPTIVLEQNLTVAINGVFGVHDLAISPSGDFAIASGDTVLALIDLVQNQVLDIRGENPEGLRNFYCRDSVEMNDTRAIVIGNLAGVGGNAERGRAWIYDFSGGLLQQIANQSLQSATNRMHDLVLTPDGTKAIARATSSLVVFEGVDTANPTSQVFTTRNRFVQFGTNFISDSLVATDIGCAVIGSIGNRGAIDFLNLQVSPVGAPTSVTLPSLGSPTLAGDIEVTRDGLRVLAHFSDFPNANPGDPAGVELVLLSMSPFGSAMSTVLARFGTTGGVFGLDSVAVGADRAISITEIPPGGTTGMGFVQILDL